MSVRVVQLGKFYPPYMGGIETHLEALCGQLRDGFDVQVIVCNSAPGTSSEVCDGIRVTRLSTPLRINNAPVSPGLARAIRRAKPDLVHLHLPHPGGILGLLGSRYRGPLVLTHHSDVVRQRLLPAVFKPLLDTVMRRAGAILVTSPNYLATSPVLAPYRDRCHVVPYGIPLARFDTPDRARVAEITARFGPRLLLAVGRLVYYKGFDVLVRAMRFVDARLVIIGEGPLEQRLRAQAAAEGVEDKVTWLGEVQNAEVAPFFAAADVFVLPSVARSEAFGIVQLEAMASGTPVVNTSLDSGVPWVSQHEVTGLTVPPNDPQALGAALERLLNDRALRARLGAAARARTHAEFDVTVMGNRVADLYRQVLAV
jgi:rhamnosyl/mannosyltransferase